VIDGVRCYCMFIGYPRSGHSLVGSLVGAHRNAVISHELDALRYVQTGLIGRDLLYSMILRRDREFGKAGRRWTGYDYSVPGQSQGRVEDLLVIGDKRGGGSTRRLGAHPDLLDRLERLVDVDVRLIHVIRDPYDTIASMHRRGRQPLTASIERFFALCATNASIREHRPGAVVDVRVEELIRRPAETVAGLVGSIGLDAPETYLGACAGIVFATPKRTRTSIDWPDHLIADVAHRMSSYDFLRGYSYEG
ncbi:MAG TPA: sulfotransferase, partial [Actinomycetota bacterium]